jgi:HK97 gp10 family phage protein
MVASRPAGNLRFTWYGAQVLAKIDAAVGNAMDQTAVAAKAAAIEKCPVGDGKHNDEHLYETIDAQVDTTGSGRRRLVLSADKPYAVFVELGTSRMSAQPFLRPAMDQEAPKLTQRIRAALGSSR